jgi:polyisoprenyl-phosphate glycosyltransferase
LTARAFEVVLVDDGSSDGSAELLDKIHERDPRFKVLHLARNFGHQAALQAGLDVAGGDAVVLMDADLQDRPEQIEEFVDRWRQGYDVVFAVRTKRKESWAKRAAYALFYRSLRAIAELEMPLDAGDFSLLDRRVVDAIVAMPERDRLLRGLRTWVGFRQMGIPCERDARGRGASKYTALRLTRLAMSGYLGFSAVPLRLASWLGLVSAAAGFSVMLWVIVTKLLEIPSPRGWASTLAAILFVGGVQMLLLGILGEYLGRVYDEVRGRPIYVIARSLGVVSGSPGEPAHPEPDT